jgi:transposase
MRNGKRGGYTLEFKLETVRLVESGQSIAERSAQHGCCRADVIELGQGASRGQAEGGHRQDRGHGGADGDQSLASRIGGVKMERDVLRKATAYFAKGQK